MILTGKGKALHRQNTCPRTEITTIKEIGPFSQETEIGVGWEICMPIIDKLTLLPSAE